MIHRCDYSTPVTPTPGDWVAPLPLWPLQKKKNRLPLQKKSKLDPSVAHPISTHYNEICSFSEIYSVF
jgi:hypothetical protein